VPRKLSLRPNVAAKENNGVAAALLAGLTTLGGVYTTLGVTNVLGEMARDHAVTFGIAAVCAVLAVMAGVVGGYVSAGAEAFFFIAGLVLLTASLVFAAIGATLVWGDDERPRIEAHVVQVDGKPVLDVGIDVDGLSFNDHLSVLVEPLDLVKGEYTARRAIYTARVGPSSDGKAAVKTQLALPPGRYVAVNLRAWINDDQPPSCTHPKGKTGCLFLRVSRLPERPQLTAALSADRRAVVIGITATDNTRQTIRVRVMGRMGAKHELARLVVAPDASGKLDKKLEVPLPARVRSVCIAASARLDRPKCPPRRTGEADTTWIRVKRAPQTP
jgi:hypothetical protein